MTIHPNETKIIAHAKAGSQIARWRDLIIIAHPDDPVRAFRITTGKEVAFGPEDFAVAEKFLWWLRPGDF